MVTIQMRVSFQLVASIIPNTTNSVSTSAAIVIIPWEKTWLMVSRSLMVLVVILPIGVRSK